MARTTLGLLAIALTAPAQQRMMVVESSDDGGPPQVMHFAGPDIGDLRRPDYVRRDLPIFREKLELDEVQRLIVGVLLDTYLDAFKALVEQRFPKLHDPMMLGMGGAPETPGTAGAPREFEELDVDVEAIGGGQVAIAIRAGADGAALEAEGEAGSDGVVVSVQAPEGVEIPEALREKLEARARELAEKLRERLAELEAGGEAPGPGAAGEPVSLEQRRAQLEEMRAALDRFARQKEALRRDFLAEVRGQLTAEQLGNWPAFERAMTRIKTLPRGRLDGERTDLIEIVEGLGLSSQAQEAVAEALLDYEIALDEALQRRNDALRDSEGRLSEAIHEGRFGRAAAIADEASGLRVRVREVNEQYTQTIAASLPPEAAAEFRAAALKRSYPRVYRRTPARKTFAAAAGLQLEQDVAEAIASLETAYDTDVDVLNEHIRRVIRREQPKQARRMVERIRAMMAGEGAGGMPGGADEDDPIRAAFEKRRALDERYIKHVHALLTPEQIAEVTRK